MADKDKPKVIQLPYMGPPKDDAKEKEDKRVSKTMPTTTGTKLAIPMSPDYRDRNYAKGGKVKKYASGGTTDEKSFPRRMYEKVMGTPEQNAEAQKRMDEQDKKNPDSIPAKINKVVKTVTGKKNGGMTASRRGDGCAQRGKTKGRMV